MQNSSSLPCSAAITMPPPGTPFSRLPEYTLGGHLAQRLVEVGVNDIFSLAGDFNLTLLNHLIAHPELNSIACCNELNAGYAADGYARARGVGACVVTFTVGGLSLINAIAGAYSENIPVICIVGGPNSNDYRTKKVIHHSTGSADFSQELRCFQAVTCYQAVINDLEDAHELIDTAISKALEESKPVYISISCNLAGIPHHSFYGKSIPFCLSSRVSNEMALEAAVEAASDFLNNAVKPVLVGGPMLRAANAGGAFANLADSCGYALAVMPSAKGLVREQNPRFIGTYWGAASTAFCAEVVESADAYLFAGPVFGDYITVGNTLLVKKEKAILVGTDQVIIGHGAPYRNVLMRDFLERLAGKVKFNGGSYEIHRRIYVADGVPVERYRNEDLRLCVLMQHIQSLISRDVESTVIAETGGSWFNCQKLKLPDGCRYESQMQYGSVGWSVGATLGYAQAARGKRVVTCIGDGSFQVAAQEISTILCCGLNPIIILLNNGGYATSKAIQDGPYNVIRNWNHIGVVNAINNGRDKCWTSVVSTEAQLIEAFETAYGAKYECLCFIEVILHKDDTSRELLNWSSRVSAANNTPPNFH